MQSSAAGVQGGGEQEEQNGGSVDNGRKGLFVCKTGLVSMLATDVLSSSISSLNLFLLLPSFICTFSCVYVQGQHACYW